MNKIAIILMIFSSLFAISCKSQGNIVEIKLQKCINTRINNGNYKTNKSTTSIHFYKVISNIESYFIEKNILNDVSKEGYLKAINKIFNNENKFYKEIYNDIVKIMNKENYNGLYFSSAVLQDCPSYIINSEKEIPKSLINQYTAMEKLYASGPYEQDYVNELVTKVSDKDFIKIVYRAPIIITLYDLIRSKLRKNNKSD